MSDAAAGFDRMLVVIAEDLLRSGEGPLYALAFTACYVAGLAIAVSSLMKMTRAASAGPMGMHSPWAGPIMGLVVATMLVALPTAIDVGTESIFMGNTSPLSWSDMESRIDATGGLDERVQRVIWASIMIIQFVGLIAFVRGLFLMKANAEGNSQATIGQALTHMIGGVLAINLGELIKVLEVTFDITLGLGMEFGGMPDFSGWI
ncbi:MAG: type IVB secretion system protein IcmC/DotE [Alphaproteobacteria bacterium]